MISGMNFGTEILNNLYKAVIRIGGTEEQIFEKTKTGSSLYEKWAKDIVGSVFNLKHLKILEEGIKVRCKGFNKKDLFSSTGPIKLYFGNNFQNLVLPEIADIIPASEKILSSLDLTESMHDFAIREEVGELNVVSATEWAQEFIPLLLDQPVGQGGRLLSNGYSNIRYVKLNSGKIVVVHAYWNADYRKWSLTAYELGDYRWFAVNRVFARS